MKGVNRPHKPDDTEHMKGATNGLKQNQYSTVCQKTLDTAGLFHTIDLKRDN